MSFTISTPLFIVILLVIIATLYILPRLSKVNITNIAFMGFGVLALGLGFYLFFVYAPGFTAEAERLSQLTTDVARLSDLSPNDEILVTSTLQAGEALRDSEARINDILGDTPVVAYDIQRWERYTVDNADRIEERGRWVLVRQNHSGMALAVADLTFTIADGGVPLENANEYGIWSQPQAYFNPPPQSCLDACYEENALSTSCERECSQIPRYQGARYGERYLLEGSLRVMGYEAGNRITVHGRMLDRTTIQPIRLLQGNRQALVDSVGGEAATTRIGALLAMLVGGGFLVYSLSQLRRTSGVRHEPALSPEELARRSR